MYLKRVAFILTAVLFIFQLSGIAQDSATVRWKATGKKIGEGQYQIQLKGTIKTGWQVYPKNNTTLEIEGLKITFSDSAIQKNGSQQLTGNLKTITDKIFDFIQQGFV